MKLKPEKRPVTFAQRLRSRGYWSIVIGFIGLVGCLVGTFQLWIYGMVSIRPGHESVSGDSAIQMLYVLGLVSVFFTVYGVLQVYRARQAMRSGGG